MIPAPDSVLERALLMAAYQGLSHLPKEEREVAVRAAVKRILGGIAADWGLAIVEARPGLLQETLH